MFEELGNAVLDGATTRDEAKKSAIQYCERRQTDRSVIMTVAGITNIKMDYDAFGKGDASMCTLFEEIAKEGEEKGRAEGLAEGRAEGHAEGLAEGRAEGRAEAIIDIGYEMGLSDRDILARLQEKLNISSQKAQEYFRNFCEL